MNCLSPLLFEQQLRTGRAACELASLLSGRRRQHITVGQMKTLKKRDKKIDFLKSLIFAL